MDSLANITRDKWWLFISWFLRSHIWRHSSDQVSVWAIWLGILSNIRLLPNVFGPCRQRHWIQFTWSAPKLAWEPRETCSPSWYEKGTVSFDVIIFNRCPLSSWVELLVSRTQRKLFNGTLWYSNNLWHLRMGTLTTWQSNNEFKNYRPNIGWHDCNFDFKGQFTYSDSMQLNGSNDLIDDGSTLVWVPPDQT